MPLYAGAVSAESDNSPERHRLPVTEPSVSSDTDGAASTAIDGHCVLIPLRSFSDGKSRLSAALTTSERESLQRSWATAVIDAARGLRVVVATDDAEVANFARTVGAEVTSAGVDGLNETLDAATATVVGRNERVTIVHADIPGAVDYRSLVEDLADDQALIVTDTEGRGTNLLSVPSGVRFRNEFGLDSADRHERQLLELGLRVDRRTDPELSFDVDEPADLDVALALPRTTAVRVNARPPGGVGSVGARGHSLDIDPPERVLAVGAHPDDIEFQAGATIAKWVRHGSQVHLAVLTDGSKGTWDPTADTAAIAARRREEQQASAVQLGVTAVHFIDQIDGELRHERALVDRIAELIRGVRPDVVLGHDPWRPYRLHPDHRAAGWIVVDAIVVARDPHFLPGSELSAHRPGDLLLFDTDGADHAERLSDADVDAKIRALECHVSQFETTHHHRARGSNPSVEFRRLQRRQARADGESAGVRNAERFVRVDPAH